MSVSNDKLYGRLERAIFSIYMEKLEEEAKTQFRKKVQYIK